MSKWMLALDTATPLGSVAIARVDGRDGWIERSVSNEPRQHAAKLVPTVETVLADAGATLREVVGVVVGDGPGSFTGVRVATAAAKGLCFHPRAAFYAVPSLYGCAAGAAQLVEPPGPVAAVYDALRGQVFVAVWAESGLLLKPRLADVDALQELGPVAAAAGPGAHRHAAAVRAWTGRAPLAPSQARPSAGRLIDIVWADAGRYRVPDADSWEPTYGRLAEAQVRWEAQHGRPLAPHPPR